MRREVDMAGKTRDRFHFASWRRAGLLLTGGVAAFLVANANAASASGKSTTGPAPELQTSVTAPETAAPDRATRDSGADNTLGSVTDAAGVGGGAIFSMEIVEVDGVPQPAGTTDVTASPGGILKIEYYLQNWAPDIVEAYQVAPDLATLTNGPGSSLDLANPLPCTVNSDCAESNLCVGGFCSLCDDSIFVDETRFDWIFFNALAIRGGNCFDLLLGSAVTSKGTGVDQGVPAYLGTLTLRLSAGASGDFTVALDQVRTLTGDSLGEFVTDESATLTVHTASAGCGQDATILVSILTDNYGSETTWEVTEQGTGIVMGSGGPYGNATLYETEVCVDSTSCYDFIIYDSYGDGIFGPGYYEVRYNGGLVGSGGVFGASETVGSIGDGCGGCQSNAECDDGLFCNGVETCNLSGGTCVPGTPVNCDDGDICTLDSCDEALAQCVSVPDPVCDLGACCIGPDCLDNGGAGMQQPECDGIGGVFHAGLRCIDNPCEVTGDGFIPGNFGDCWKTECGDTQFGFAKQPIPAGFFNTSRCSGNLQICTSDADCPAGVTCDADEEEPLSLAFVGSVLLEDIGLGDGATVMNRLNDMDFTGLPLPATLQTEIEILELHLRSCDPIAVTYCCDPLVIPTLWDVEVTLSAAGTPVAPGTMTVTKEHANGGTFTSWFEVKPRFTFTRVDDPTDVRVLDTGLEGISPETMSIVEPAPWVHVHPDIQGCGQNFIPGMEANLGPRAGIPPCCKRVGHGSPGGGSFHDTAPPDCSACPGACCDSSVNPATCTYVVESACPAGCEWKGIDSTCDDLDGDGLVDAFEINDCCAATNPCNLWTDPNNPDTDGDGIDDGTEIINGTSPCDPCDPNPTAPVCDTKYGSDCNENGWLDSCDIKNGTSADCNDNGIPDECEPDCNLNGCPDDCDIGCGEPDANGNGVPDVCDSAGCSYDNGLPLDDFGAPATQYDDVFPFSGEAADDFVLVDDGPNSCLITGARFWALYFGVPAGVTPDPVTQWTGVTITVYDNIFPKGPSGHRLDDGTFTGTVVATQTLPMSLVTVAANPMPCMAASGFSPFQIDLRFANTPLDLQKNHKYWIVFQPHMDFTQFGQVAVMLSQGNTDHPAQQIFPLAGIDPWVEIAGSAGTDSSCNPDPPGTYRDIAFVLFGEKGCAKPAVAGEDCWSTPCGDTTYDLVDSPIPADFFGPGSDPFDGQIDLGGQSGFIDTLVARRGDMCFDGELPVTDSVPIELVHLDLGSCQPITVTFNGGQNPEDWDVRVFLDGPQPQGLLTATKLKPIGGIFDTVLRVRPGLEFTSVVPQLTCGGIPDGTACAVDADCAGHADGNTCDPTPPRILTTGEVTTLSSSGLEWVQNEPPTGAVCGAAGGFFPGYPKHDTPDSCCEESCHEGPSPGHEHCVIPPECPLCLPTCDKPALAGDDCWTTECGNTEYDFAVKPIPAGFFGLGSDPVSEIIQLGGASGAVDTIIRRLDDMCFDGPLPLTDTTRIQVTQLDLAGCQPITVTFNGGQNPESWSVEVFLDGVQPIGNIKATKKNENGGSFSSYLPVVVGFRLTPPGPGAPVLFLPGTTINLVSGTLPWVQDDPPNAVCGIGGGFHPGHTKDDMSCCPESCHAGPAPGHEHCTRPAGCPGCDCTKLALAAEDCWSTPCGNTTYNFADSPIPAGFFYNGSDPFTGLVQLGGQTGFIDTKVERFLDMCFDGQLPVTDSTTIKLTQLDLASCQPITVTGTQPAQLWNITVFLDGPQPQGLLTATKLKPEGGIFETVLPVLPGFQFDEVAGPNVRMLLPGVVTNLSSDGLEWAQNPPASGAVCGAGGFYPGFPKHETPDGCCEESCHAGPSPDHQHCVVPPKCPICQPGCTKPAVAGDDCWSTDCASGGTDFDFGGDPIPADFFGPGSDPFTQLVQLGGTTGFIDTVVSRLGDMCFDGTLPVTDATPVQVTQLDLIACQQITVTFNGGQSPELWDLVVSLDGDQPIGNIKATKTNPTGGTFSSYLPVRPLFTFIPPGTGQPLVFAPGTVIGLTSASAPWAQNDPGAICGAGGGFFPGYQKDDPTCCPETCHAGPAPGHEHCVLPPECPKCPEGACCDHYDGQCIDGLTEAECNLIMIQPDYFPNEECSVIQALGLCERDEGACCYKRRGRWTCRITDKPGCEALTEGWFLGHDTECPKGKPNKHKGVAIVHYSRSSKACSPPGGPLRGGTSCIAGMNPIDPWVTDTAPQTCHQFDVGAESPAIPADFFGPGSDPYTGQVCLEGVPLGDVILPGDPNPPMDFGEADTLIRRSADPFDRCDLPGPLEVTVDVEVVALNLKSIDPIIVTFNGGQDPQQWDVTVDLSQITPAPGWIRAVKTHCNGGTYQSELHVQPRFTFTEVADPGNVHVLDTGLEGIPAAILVQPDPDVPGDPDPVWISDLPEDENWGSPICSDFHPGLENAAPPTGCAPACDAGIAPPLPADEMSVPGAVTWPLTSRAVTCTTDADCTNQAVCLPDAAGAFPGTCYVPKNRYLAVAPNSTNATPTARRLSVELSQRLCNGTGPACVSNTDCTGTCDDLAIPCASDGDCSAVAAGATCASTGTCVQVLGFVTAPNAKGYASIEATVTPYTENWNDGQYPIDCGTNSLCPANAYCDTGLGGSVTCKWSADDTQVLWSYVFIGDCRIGPMIRDVVSVAQGGLGENKAARRYLVESILATADITDESAYSVALILPTVKVWGDSIGASSSGISTPPNDLAGFTDVLHQVFRFKDTGQSHLSWGDLHPQDPNQLVGFQDMLDTVNGFKDKPYPYDDPCTCANDAEIPVGTRAPCP